MTKRPPFVATALAATLVLATSLPTLAASNLCDFLGYADWTDPAGTNVRSGPGTSYDIVATLMPKVVEESYTFTPQFAVTAFKDGWFQIGDAVAGQYEDGPERTVFVGPGWVSAKLVDYDIQDWHLRDAPSLDAKVTFSMDVDTPWALDNVRVTKVHGCEGGFLDVTLTNGAGDTKRGWVTNLCGNQATTCS